jgi:hypothetical protein
VPMRRTLALLPALTLLAACDGGGGSDSDRLTPQEVAGVYNLCTVRFQPANPVLPIADLMETVIDTTPPAGRPEATIALTANGTYELAYTSAETSFIELVRGSINYHQTAIALGVPTDQEATVLLLPRPLILTFNSTTGRLTGDASETPHPVARYDYARAAGVSEEGLQSTINGVTKVVFAQGACP